LLRRARGAVVGPVYPRLAQPPVLGVGERPAGGLLGRSEGELAHLGADGGERPVLRDAHVALGLGEDPVALAVGRLDDGAALAVAVAPAPLPELVSLPPPLLQPPPVAGQ